MRKFFSFVNHKESFVFLLFNSFYFFNIFIFPAAAGKMLSKIQIIFPFSFYLFSPASFNEPTKFSRNHFHVIHFVVTVFTVLDPHVALFFNYPERRYNKGWVLIQTGAVFFNHPPKGIKEGAVIWRGL